MTSNLRPIKWIVMALAAVALAIAMLAVAPPQRAHAQAAGGDVQKVRIEVDDIGFEGDSGDFTVEVEQGRMVEMTFVWAHVGYIEEEHIFLLEMGGQNLEWDQIDIHNKEATLQFIPTTAGSFDFKCDLDCEIHDYLQKGHLVVKGGGGGGATFTPTVLKVTPSSWASTGDPISLTAVLTDNKEAPVAKASIKFYLDAEFVGTEGKMLVGSATTDANGVAFLDYEPTMDMQNQVITARFDGLGIYDKTDTAIEIKQILPPDPAYKKEPIGLQLFWDWGPRVLTVATVAVWVTLLYILFQGISVAWARKR